MLIYLANAISHRMRSVDDEGATAVEYGLMVALIAVVIIGAVMALGENITGMFNGVATEIADNTP